MSIAAGVWLKGEKAEREMAEASSTGPAMAAADSILAQPPAGVHVDSLAYLDKEVREAGALGQAGAAPLPRLLRSWRSQA